MSQLVYTSTHGQRIPFAGAQWITGMILDPTGRVFLHEDSVYRYVYPKAAARVRAMFDNGLVQDLVERGLLVPTEIFETQTPDGGLVLRHQRIAFLVNGSEWTRLQLRDVALTWIDLNLALAERGFATTDAHWGNFAQLGLCRPTWIDFGSITELKRNDQGLAEFRRYYRHPLQLAARSSGLSRLIRAVNLTGGLNDYEFSSLAFAMIPVAGRQLQNGFDRIRRNWRTLRARWSSRTSRDEANASREEILLRERERISRLKFPDLGTAWGEYQPDQFFHETVNFPPDSRRGAILRTLDELRPRRMIDFASNAGYYSFHTARLGTEVFAVDYDEKAIERLYSLARSREEKLNITAACGDVMRPPVARFGWRREADLVLALALTHHLVLGQGYSIPAVLDALAHHTTDKLLVEFMPHGLGGTKPKPDPLPDWYRRELFESELASRFERVRVVVEHQLPQWRVLYLAEGKRP